MLFELLNDCMSLVQCIAAASPSDAALDQAVITTVQNEAAVRSDDDSLGYLIPIVGIVMGCSIAIVAIIASTMASNQKEKTRREIAAYVAEGTISPEDGERMMRAASTCSKN